MHRSGMYYTWALLTLQPAFLLLLLLKHFKGLFSPAQNYSFNNSFCCLYKNQGHCEMHFTFPGLNNLQSSVVNKFKTSMTSALQQTAP